MASVPPTFTTPNLGTTTTTTPFTTTATPTSDTSSWIHGCFMVTVGTDFATYQDVLKYTQQDELYGSSTAPALDPNVSTILNSAAGSDDSPLPVYFTKRKCRDTSLGGNDAINPLPQFSLDDDISHPHYYSSTGTNIQMGQVYSENYDDLQQVLYLGFGIPLFSNVGGFWATATDMDMAGLVNSGKGITLEKIGYLLGSAPVRIIQIATIPYKFIWAMSNTLQQVPISKYYSFSSQMPMYFRFVNTIMVMLATNMNIVGSNPEYSTTGSNVSGTTSIGLDAQGTQPTDSLDGLPDVFKNFGLDMARIMTKRFLYENGNLGSLSSRFTDDAIIKSSNGFGGQGVNADVNATATASTNATANTTNSNTTTTDDPSTDPSQRNWEVQWIDSFKAAYGDAIYDGHLFIGFRIDKGMGASESFSNSTGESQISQTVNSQYDAGRESGFQAMHGSPGSDVLSTLVSGVTSAVSGVLKGAASFVKLDPLAAVATGGARISIPDVWMSSSWSRSTSFTITCIAPYGDFETIFMSEYVPLACILAGALPRGTGHSSHSSPFVCQAYCRGVFSSPLCMIETLEVTRGADQFGMNAARLPLKLTMHVTLKDLSPVMYMTMGGAGSLTSAIMGTDDNFGEYMMTLSGMGLRDRLSPFKNIRRKLDILMSTVYKNKLSPYMLGMEGGSNFLISRMISTIKGAGRNLPGN